MKKEITKNNKKQQKNSGKFATYKFRASELWNLMVDPRSKSETLSETTKTWLKEIYLREVWGRDYSIIAGNKYTEKGNYAEEDSLNLLTKVKNKIYFKNKKHYENEWIQGTPDIILKDRIIDIKTCWDMKTYINKESVEKNYFYQLQGYMWLTGLKQAELIFTLVNTPEHLIVSEKNKRLFYSGLNLEEGTPEFLELEEAIEKLMTFDDVPEHLRIKTFIIERDDAEIEKMGKRIQDARLFLDQISLI